MLRLCATILFFVLCVSTFAGQTPTELSNVSGSPAKQNHLITLHGRVVDARTGEPVAKVKIIVVGAQQSSSTDENAKFILEAIQPGKLDLYITTVGYGLVKKTLTVKEGESAEVEIALNQEGATLTEKVTVTAAPFAEIETNTPSEKTLSKTELQSL